MDDECGCGSEYLYRDFIGVLNCSKCRWHERKPNHNRMTGTTR